MQTPHMKQIGHLLGQYPTFPCHNNQKLTHIKLTDLMKHIHPTNLYEQQQASQTPFDFNQSVIKLFRHQTELTHRAQHLHQQTRDVLNDIAKSSSLQEYFHFINDILIFKATDPQSFDEWLEQIDNVTSLKNKDPCKLTLAKSQGSFSRAISSYPPTLGWNKIKE